MTVRMGFSASQEQQHFLQSSLQFCMFTFFCLFVFDFCLLVGWLVFCRILTFVFLFFSPFSVKSSPTSKMYLLGPHIDIKHPTVTLKTSCVLVIEHHLEVFTIRFHEHSPLNVSRLDNHYQFDIERVSEVLANAAIFKSQIYMSKTLHQALIFSNTGCFRGAELIEWLNTSLQS